MFKRILVAVDGSKSAMKALDKAIELQALAGAELNILTVYRHHSLLEASFSMVRPENPALMDDAMREHARGVAEEAKSYALEHGAKDPHAFVRNGPVARGIVGFVTEHDVDLVVLGRRGLGSLEEFLLGSVSHKVSGLCSCPVLVV